MVADLAVQHSTNTLQQVAFALGAIGAIIALIVIYVSFRRSRRKR